MYSFIFNFFYRYHKKGRSFGPRSTAALAVAITVFFQLFCLATAIKFFTGVNLAGKEFSDDYFTNKLHLMPFMMLYGLIFILYYTHKRAMAIVNKYPQDYKVVTIKNVLLVLLIMIVPLLIGIKFLQHSH
ncbi:MAG: hypothetical protein MUC81_11910 [Bacteroidia bacterium]|nr:hypothetical protein [Bacteroidia bacterium]